ncbi:MAG: hypothetical protein HXY26_10900 [Hydrogenophilaceae bacterium]|nr:hypothetical protein [Hydrogenophilaceae bacterium]
MAEPISSLVSDAEGQLVNTSYVVIYAPQVRNRKRFPEGVVTVYESEAAARAASNPEAGYHAAIASGPSRSSEGFHLFYLVRWLD